MTLNILSQVPNVLSSTMLNSFSNHIILSLTMQL